jgi:hypothetical protein
MTSAAQIQEFKQHPVWEGALALKSQVDDTAPRSSDDRHTLARVRAVCDYVHAFRSFEPYLFPQARVGTADVVQAKLAVISAQVEGWDQDAGMLQPTIDQIDGSVDAILGAIASGNWPALQRESRARAIINASQAFIDTADQSLTALKGSIDDAQTELGDLDARVVALTQEATIRGQEAATARETMDHAVAEFEVDSKAAAAAQVEAMNAAATAQRDSIQEKAAVSLESLTADAEQGKKLLSMIGDGSLAGGYDKFARSEKVGYRLWNVAGAATTIATLIYLVYELETLDLTDPAVSVVKAAVTLTAIGFATFAFREAGKRQRQSLEARYRALDLVALRPYATELSDKDAQEMRVLLGRRLFSSGPTSRADDDENVVPSSISMHLKLDDLKKLSN